MFENVCTKRKFALAFNKRLNISIITALYIVTITFKVYSKHKEKEWRYRPEISQHKTQFFSFYPEAGFIITTTVNKLFWVAQNRGNTISAEYDTTYSILYNSPNHEINKLLLQPNTITIIGGIMHLLMD